MGQQSDSMFDMVDQDGAHGVITRAEGSRAGEGRTHRACDDRTAIEQANREIQVAACCMLVCLHARMLVCLVTLHAWSPCLACGETISHVHVLYSVTNSTCCVTSVASLHSLSTATQVGLGLGLKHLTGSITLVWLLHDAQTFMDTLIGTHVDALMGSHGCSLVDLTGVSQCVEPGKQDFCG